MIKLNTSISEIKNEAKANFDDKINLIIIIGFLYFFIASSVPNLISVFTTSNQAYTSLLYTNVISGPISLGIAICSLKLIKNEDLNTYTFFEGFSNLFKSIGLHILLTLIYIIPLIPVCIILFAIHLFTKYKIFNFSIELDQNVTFNSPYLLLIGLALIVVLILVFVAIIYLFLRYSFTFFILAENTNIKLRHTLKISAKMMKKNYSKCLLLYLSFIGWGILFTLISSTIMYFVVAVVSNIIISTILSQLIYCVVFAYFVIHIEASVGVLYLKIKENLSENNFVLNEKGNLVNNKDN